VATVVYNASHKSGMTSSGLMTRGVDLSHPQGNTVTREAARKIHRPAEDRLQRNHLQLVLDNLTNLWTPWPVRTTTGTGKSTHFLPNG